MEANEWALIIFSTIMQMAVGSFVILGGVHFLAVRGYSVKDADLLADRAILAIGPLVILSLLVTFLHLGNPINAPRAITNFESSWLSREIVLSLVFTIGGAAFALMQWRKISTPSVRNGVALVVAAIGLVLVYSMARIYSILVTVPAWNTPATPAAFFLTTFLLGTLAVGSAYVATYWYLTRKETLPGKEVQSNILATTLRWMALLSIVLLGIQFVVIPLYLADLAADSSPAASESISIILNENGILFALRLILLFLGAGIFAVFVYVNATSEAKAKIAGNLAYAAFALVLISEIIGRFLFYASRAIIGL
jgi:anaerobic dimethyl sulfoxide reductase subunit C (anchor subunit)